MKMVSPKKLQMWADFFDTGHQGLSKQKLYIISSTDSGFHDVFVYLAPFIVSRGTLMLTTALWALWLFFAASDGCVLLVSSL